MEKQEPRRAKITQALLQSSAAAPGERVYDINDTDLRGFMVRVQPSGVRSFYIRYKRPDGGARTMKVCDAAKVTPQQARARARQLLADVELGADPQGERRAAKAETLGEYLDGPYAEHVLPKRRSQSNAAMDLARLKASFKGLLGKRLSELTAWDVERWRTGRQKETVRGKPISTTTVNLDVAVLRSALSEAVRMGLLQEHPLRNLRRLKNATGQRVRYLSADELSRLEVALQAREAGLRAQRQRYNLWRVSRRLAPLQDLSACEYADHLRPMFLLATHTGVRRGELFNVEWRDIDLDRHMLTVRSDSSKSGKVRHIPLNDVAHGVLQAWREQTTAEGLVFKSPQGGGRFENVNKAWRAVMKDAGVSGLRWHDLRHEFASRLVMSGVNLNVVRELLGHSDLSMTLRYAHLAPEATAEAVAKISGWGAANVLPFAATDTGE